VLRPNHQTIKPVYAKPREKQPALAKSNYNQIIKQTTKPGPKRATARMNWVAREREQREVNGYPRNAPVPRNTGLANSFNKNLISTTKLITPHPKQRDEWGGPENAGSAK
jgi:hypothetical protein